MPAAATHHNDASWIEHEREILPIITTLFVNGLGQQNCCSSHYVRTGINSAQRNSEKKSNRTQESCKKDWRRPKKGSISVIPFDADRISLGGQPSKTSQQNRVVRNLIGGISHHFNNLFMGIWGNATLIRLQLSDQDARYASIRSIEHLIQSGAFLIHMVLGYVGERRAAEKQMRLNQLISEIKKESGIGNASEDPWNLEALLDWATQVQQPRIIAGSTAGVLELLFESIESRLKDVSSRKIDHPNIENKLAKIEALIRKAFDIIWQMRCYAADLAEFSRTNTQIEKVVKRAISNFRKQYPRASIKTQISRSIPTVCINRFQIGKAIEAILSNSIGNGIRQDTISVSVRSLFELPTNERYALRRSGNYVVIDVANARKEIPSAAAHRMFEPFYTYPASSRSIGLEMSAADGILKHHEGFILFESSQDRRLLFRICLPAAK